MWRVDEIFFIPFFLSTCDPASKILLVVEVATLTLPLCLWKSDVATIE